MWQLAASSVAALALAYCLQQAARFFRFWKKNWTLVNQFPHDDNWSYVFGSFEQEKGQHWTAMVLDKYMTWTEKYKEAFTSFVGPKMIAGLTIVHPAPMQAVLTTADGKSTDYNFFKEWLGDGLLLSRGAKWQRNRKLLTPAFHFGILKTYVGIYNEAADTLLEKLHDHCGSGPAYWDVSKDVNLTSLDVILQCAFSSKTNCQMNSDNEYVRAVTEVSSKTVKRLINPLLRPDVLYEMTSEGRQVRKALSTLHGLSRNIIGARKKFLAENPRIDSLDPDRTRHVDFLDILLTVKDSDGNPMSDEDIKAEVDTFLFEGHDTTASALSWILYLFAKYPEHQLRIQEKIDRLLEGRTCDDITWNDLPELKELTLFIKEAMRIFPPVPTIGRCTENDMVLCGQLVPKGTLINIVVYALHHNRHVWGDDVEDFKPERFSLDNADKINPFAYVPFSAGPRNCIGQNFAMNEIKVVVSRILRRFSLSTHPSIVPKPAMVVVLRTQPGHPILLKIEPRRN